MFGNKFLKNILARVQFMLYAAQFPRIRNQVNGVTWHVPRRIVSTRRVWASLNTNGATPANRGLRRPTPSTSALVSGARSKALVSCLAFREHSAVADELKSALNEFVRFAQSLRGDEKSEAQTFLDHFFRALGHQGVIEAGATFEFRVAKKPDSPQLELVVAGIADPGHRPKGGKKFADLLWPDRVLIEMKSRGENLEKHYDQAFDYWTHIVPKRPPFVILCNFDEFWIYDFNTQLFDPVDRIKITELPENISALNFLLPIWKKPIFGNNWVDVTRRAADQMATVFREIVDRGEDRERAQRFILQLLVALVAEDIGLLPEQLVSELLHECADEGASSYDLIGGLFRQMATKQTAPAGRYKSVQHFNGGLFAVV